VRPSLKLSNVGGSLGTSLGSIEWREPRVYMRAILAVLLIGNLVLLWMLMFPPGGSPEEVEQTYVVQQQQRAVQAKNLQRMRVLAAKVQESRAQGDQFLASYFMERRKAASTIISELNELARTAGIKPKEHSFLLEPVEGSDDLSMMTVNGSYDGTYADLIQFVNRVDRSKRFLIIDSLSASPQQQPGLLNVSVRFHVFVREGAGS
jgi:Tfp pilus assembly protein PilO